MPSDIVKLNECSTLDGTQYLVDEDLHGAKVLRSGHFLPDGSVVLTKEEAKYIFAILSMATLASISSDVQSINQKLGEAMHLLQSKLTEEEQ